VYRVWMRIGHMIGSVISRIILGVVFFLVVTPLGLMMRATGKDPMNRRFDASLPSYREAISENKSNSFDKPF
jgi:large-conductance mechanosensitive channel